MTYTPAFEGWAAKEVTNKGVTHIELRKTMGYPHHDGAQLLIIVALDGYNFKASYQHPDDQIQPDKWNRSSKGVQVRMSLNNSARMTLDEFSEIDRVVQESYWWLLIHTQAQETLS